MKQAQIFILHGWAISKKNKQKWQPLIKCLKSHQIKVSFLQIPGLDYDIAKPMNLNQYQTWLEEKLQGKKNIILLGHSFGGQLAIRYTTNHKKQITKLILIGNAGIIDQRIHKVIKRKVFWVLAKTGKLIFRHPLFRKILYKLAREHDYYEANKVMRKSMQQVIKDEIIQDLPEIKCPVQIIWGQNDTSTPLSVAQPIFNKKLKNFDLQIINNSRHSPQFTHTQQVCDIIKNFIK